jgi:FkbM family methyltransferase
MAQLMLFRRELAWVRRDAESGGWSHFYRQGVFVSPRARGVPWKQAERNTRDIFFHAYEPREGDTVLELGAEYGTETVTLSRAVGSTGRVIAVEAHPWTCELLRRTIAENGLTNVEVVNAAVVGKVGTVTISDSHDATLTNTVFAETGIEVPGVTVDALVVQFGLTRIDLLKVNIEGAERDALSSMTSSVPLVRNAVVSCHDFVADAGGNDAFRTAVDVDSVLRRWTFSVTTRPSDQRPWVRDYRYAQPS